MQPDSALLRGISALWALGRQDLVVESWFRAGSLIMWRLGKLRPVGEAETSVAYTEQLRDFS